MEEWKKYKLSEVCENIYSGGTPSSMNASYWNGDLPWLSSGETNQRYIYKTEKCITEEGAKNSSTRYAYKDSTVIASAGQGHTRGQASLLCIDTYVNQSVLVLKANPLLLNPHFLFFNLDSRYNELRQLSDGTSTRGSLSGKILKDIEIFLPPLKEQKKIVSVLTSLDNKIEVNRRINDTLEQQAQALFNSWFVDFEPFKTHPFIESELGLIPEGWTVGVLSDIGEIIGGSTPSKSKPEYYTQSGIAWLTPKDLSINNYKFTVKGEIDITIEGYNSCSTKMMPAGSVLFSSRAPIGYISIAKNDICTNQGFKSIIPKKAGTAFIYYFLKTSTKEIENKATGSTFKEASGALMKSLPLVIAPKEVYNAFENLMKPIFRKQGVLEEESSTLASIRDTLLPRLMSGELEVKDIESL